METSKKLYSEGGLGLTSQEKSPDEMAKFFEMARQMFGIPNADPKDIMKFEISITSVDIPDKLKVGELSLNDCRTHGHKKWNSETRRFEWQFVTLCRDSQWHLVAV